jgi:hypothetical protein
MISLRSEHVVEDYDCLDVENGLSVSFSISLFYIYSIKGVISDALVFTCAEIQ